MNWKAKCRWKSTGLIVHHKYLKELLHLNNESMKEARSTYLNNIINRHKSNPRVLFETVITVWDWFPFYLSDRRLPVRTNKFSYNIASITWGVPQGSVLVSVFSNSKSDTWNVDIIFDSSLGFNLHVKYFIFILFFLFLSFVYCNMVSSAKLGKIVHTFVSLHWNYCNALFTSLDKSFVSHLQAIENAVASLLTCSSKQAHISPILYSLHWQLINFRIHFKTKTKF